MIRSKHPCDPTRLQSLLDGCLSDGEASAVAQHLENCAPCREHFEELAAKPTLCQEAVQMLGSADCTNTAGMAGCAAVGGDLQTVIVQYLDAPKDENALASIGEYQVLGIVGVGGMGIVLWARDRDLHRDVAIKMLAPQLAASTAARKRFAREAHSAAAVVHPHVLAIHRVHDSERYPFIVMPLIHGRSLQERIDREGPLEVAEVLRIGMQAARGLAAAHAQGLVHWDVKPANILLEDDVDRVLLTDFGLARAIDDASLTHSGMIAGTPQYMSPEQACGEDGRT